MQAIFRTYRFTQVNVFSQDPLRGNPLAVVHAAQGITDSEMATLARWTNLSETTFLLEPTDPAADYRVRIFAPSGELPFAGHPTLGSCHAWLAAGGRPRDPGVVVQQCARGLVPVRRDTARLEFLAPPLLRTGALEADVLSRISTSLGLLPSDIDQHQWVDNGPGWCAVLLRSAASVLAVEPDITQIGALRVGVVGPHADGHDAAFEVRAFVGGAEGYEDPVTGSLNAAIGQWLLGSGLARSPYVAAQGTAIGREGRVHLRRDADDVWVGGSVQTVVEGQIRL
ncbi:MAG: PhzF family phenazine biosynthesis protein [Pseudomonadota bacterium]